MRTYLAKAFGALLLVVMLYGGAALLGSTPATADSCTCPRRCLDCPREYCICNIGSCKCCACAI
jgi:hypothetical protein